MSSYRFAMPGRRPLAASSVVVGVAVAVTVLALAFVASSGPVRMWSEPPAGERVEFEPEVGGELEGGLEGSGEVSPPPVGEDGDNVLMRVLALLLLGLMIRWVWVAVLFWWRAWRHRRPRDIVRGPRAATASDLPAAADAAEVELDVDAQLTALATGDARNAIVACWSRVEDDVARAGSPRAAWETSVEFTERVLSTAVVGDDGRAAVVELAELYREARFSRHPVDDARRDRALDALRRVHAAIRVPAEPR